MNAKSIKGSSKEEVQLALNHALADGFSPTLAVVFISVKQNREEITEMLDKKGISIFGATTAGEFTDKGVEKDSVAILLLDLDTAAFEVICTKLTSESASEDAKNIGTRGIEKFSNPGFIISASDLQQEGQAIADGILETSQTSTIIGGMAGDDTYEKTTVFSNGFFSHSGIIALVIDLDKIAMEGYAISGWEPAGTEKIVTKSEDGWILEIDNQPALDVLINFLGIDINANTTDEELRETTVTFPLQVFVEEDKSMFVPPLAFNQETRGIMVPRGVPVGTKIKFTVPPDFDVVDRVIQSAKDVKNESLQSADAMIIFSCVGRLMTLGPLVNEEVNGLDEVWNVPMAGFFSYGEFGSDKGGTPDFVGTTCSWVALKEK